MSRSAIERRLSDVHERLKRARQELAVLGEQLAALNDEVDDTRVRALVGESPMSDREHRQAKRHADAMARSRDKVLATIAELERSQDELLDRLVVENS
jgi:predicted nuclease with TOPRIM domain